MENSNASKQWCELLEVHPTASAAEICHAFECLAKEVLAPKDLADWPFYAMPTSSLPPRVLAVSPRSLGWYNNWAYLWIRPYLPHDRGAGPCVVVSDKLSDSHALELARRARLAYLAKGEDVSIEELLQYVPQCKSLVRTLPQICEILTHELAHAIVSLATGNIFTEFGEFFDTEPAFARKASSLLDSQAAENKLQQENDPPPQLERHGLGFTRVVGHLDFRLKTAGVCAGDFRAAGERYRQEEYSVCYAALGDEPSHHCESTFKEILTLPMPLAFKKCKQELEEPLGMPAAC